MDTKIINLKDINKINKTDEFKVLNKDGNYAFVFFARGEWNVQINKRFNNRLLNKSFFRKTKQGAINLIKIEFKTLNRFVRN